MQSTYIFRNSSFGALLQLCFTGKLLYSQKSPIPEGFGKTSAVKDETSSIDRQGDRNIVAWNDIDDPDNPLNWPVARKLWTTAVIDLYSAAIYVGSSLYTSSQASVMAEFHVNHAGGALGLAIYILGYGLGSLLFSPLSEIPAIGRNPPYAFSGMLFIILCVPMSLVDNYPGLIVLRFLLGFMGSPCLATSGASLADMWSGTSFTIAVGAWTFIATCAPAAGPAISSFAIEHLGWRFASWELLILTGPVIIILIFFMPETSGLTILYYRAKQLREQTGNEKLYSVAQQRLKDMTTATILWDALIKPWEMNMKDPALLFTTVYMGLLYAIFYSFFESLPLLYPVIYNFSATSTSLVFLAMIPGISVSFILYIFYVRKIVVPRVAAGVFGEVENNLIPGILGGVLISAGLFVYAWTSRPSIHWIVPTIGLSIVLSGNFLVFQSILWYIPSIYPRYAASIFAANSMSRSVVAFAAVMFARPLLLNLGVSGGVSLLAALMVLCSIGMFVLWRFGKALRQRSRFTVD